MWFEKNSEENFIQWVFILGSVWKIFLLQKIFGNSSFPGIEFLTTIQFKKIKLFHSISTAIF